MKRRDIVRMASLAAAGAVTGRIAGRFPPPPDQKPVGAPSGPGQGPARGPEAPGVATAEVRPHNGNPALFLDGKPVFPAINWVSGPAPDKWDFEEQARSGQGTGIHLYAFDVGKGTEWVGPGPGRASDHDFSTVEARFRRVLSADPQAQFHLRIHLEPGHGDWWEKAHPGECEVLSDGRRNGMSFASRVWREEAKEFLLAYIAHFRKVGLYDRVIAYQVGAGHTGEWVKGESSMYAPCGDYSEPMRRYFGDWLWKRYGGDVGALRAAWRHAPAVTFDAAEVPAAARQLEARLYTFRDPAAERDVIDYFTALAELCAEAVIDLCRTVKQATDGRRLAGAFYGYLLDLAWNGGFFRERPDSDYSTYQRSGHLGLKRVLASPHVDFLVSPYSYGFRGMGGDAPSMLPAESVRLHGKLLLIEDDTRTHIEGQDANFGQAATYEASRTILRRNLAQALTQGEGAWWARGNVDTVKEPRFERLLREMRGLGEMSMDYDRSSAAEIAVLLDDESFYYETCRYDLDIPLIFQQRLWGLPRLGAPSDILLLDDFLSGALRPYKLYVFLNPFRLDAARRAALAKEIRRDGRTALWIYAPGYIKDAPGLENMSETTGFRFGLGEQPWGPLVHITDFGHPVTRDLGRETAWGTNNKLAPLFHVDDPDARVLGEVVYSQGNCRPGFAVKEFPAWSSVYSAAPNLPAPVLRAVARWAGVHIYSDAGDVLYANKSLVGVHTLAGGERVIKLPRRAPGVADLFAGRLIARGTDEFRVVLEPRSTALYNIAHWPEE